ncbi:hypothetical protein [Flavobacterium sp.]|jgi:hypothetical protein|uniref:hypothetical protein n=1 Tax=Flavobacterium sp. TaxID=239 RepID=UPI0037BED587
MKIFKLFLIAIFSLSLAGCPTDSSEDNPENYIKVTNSSSEDIFIHITMNNEVVNADYFNEKPTKLIMVNQTFSNGLSDYFFNDNKKLWILLYKKSTIDNNTWTQIQDNNLFDKRYELTLGEVETFNYNIVYNGN